MYKKKCILRIIRSFPPQKNLGLVYVVILICLTGSLILFLVAMIPSGGKMDEESMMAFMKEMKNTTELTDEEIAALAAAKIQDNKPKSRM